MATTTYVRRLGYHHFAYLRSIAEGIDIQSSAKRYLGIDHGLQATTAHEQTVDVVRSIARRRGERKWRLIGMTIRIKPGSDQPTLDQYMAERDLEGWREEEILELYKEAYPTDRKSARRYRLKESQLALLREIESLAAEKPLPTDLVTGWFSEITASKLAEAGIDTLGELGARVSRGGRWYTVMTGVGRTKALRIALHLETLLPGSTSETAPTFESLMTTESLAVPRMHDHGMLPSSQEAPSSAKSLPIFATDLDAIEAWLAAKASSGSKSKTYRREAMRIHLWSMYECSGKQFCQLSVHDCNHYLRFLQCVPSKWTSQVRVKEGALGWAPFRGSLNNQSIRQSLVIVTSMFAWLQKAQYLTGNPWLSVDQRAEKRDTEKSPLGQKVLTASIDTELLKFLDGQPPSPSRTRMRFILCFIEAVGLRSAELLNAKLGDLEQTPDGWMMQVTGRNASNRLISVPGQAVAALDEYLSSRGFLSIESAPPDAPLLASTKNPMQPIGYQALYEHVRGWFTKAAKSSILSADEQAVLSGASVHWLRHTFGSRAMAREVPVDAIQMQMGHSNVQTTVGLYGKSPLKQRVAAIEKAFG